MQWWLYGLEKAWWRFPEWYAYVGVGKGFRDWSLDLGRFTFDMPWNLCGSCFSFIAYQMCARMCFPFGRIDWQPCIFSDITKSNFYWRWKCLYIYCCGRSTLWSSSLTTCMLSLSFWIWWNETLGSTLPFVIRMFTRFIFYFRAG